MSLEQAHQTRQADRLIDDLQRPVRDLTRRIEQLEADEFSLVSPIPFNSQASSAALVDAYSTIVRANGLGLKGILREHFSLFVLNNTGGPLDLQVFFKFGGSTAFSPTFSIGTSAAGRTLLHFEHHMTNLSSASSQRHVLRVGTIAATNVSTFATETIQSMWNSTAIDTTADATLLLQIQMASSSASFQWLLLGGTLIGPLKAD